MLKAPETRLAFIPYGLMGSCWLLGETRASFQRFIFGSLCIFCVTDVHKTGLAKRFNGRSLSCWVFHRYLWTCRVENFPSFFLSKTKPLNISAILEVISPESVTFPLLLREVFGSPKRCPDKVPKLMLSNLAMAKGRANPLQICWDGQSSQELHHAFCFQHAVLAMAQENKYVYTVHYSIYNIYTWFFKFIT